MLAYKERISINTEQFIVFFSRLSAYSGTAQASIHYILEWNGDRFRSRAARIGHNSNTVINALLT